MISLTKRPEPPVITANGATWRDEFVTAVAAGGVIPDAVRYRYRHPEIKAELRLETAGKCAYCESNVSHVAPEQIEHIIPKSVRPEMVVDWHNLTLACPECNVKKGNYYSEAVPIVNPYVDDPEDHFVFWGPIVLGRPGSVRGELTAGRLELSRAGIVEQKVMKIRSLQTLVARRRAEQDEGFRELLESQIRREAEADSQYAATARHFLADVGFPL